MSEIKELCGYCLSCPKPRCETGCPTGNHIRDFIKCMKEDSLEEAASTLYAVNPFPQLTSRLCDCASQCQGHCVRGIKSNPVQIQIIERYISDQIPLKIQVGAPVGKKVALVGAGPANLACARDLVEAGYSVTMYEKEDKIGGAIYTGIPEYRFSHTYLDTIHTVLKEAGVEFVFSTCIGKDLSLQQLLNMYDEVVLGIGAQVENTYGLHGDGCVAGLSLLYDLNVLNKKEEYRKKYKSALVWGGGNVAMDCARSLVRILDDVTILYRRTRKEMPASLDEIEDAEKEGIHFAYLENIKELYADENGRITGAHCIKMHLGEPDESGRARPIETEGSDYTLPCELVVPAIGQKVSFETIGDLVLTENHHTNRKHVFVTGDAYLGPKTVAAAIHDGRKVAEQILSQTEE